MDAAEFEREVDDGGSEVRAKAKARWRRCQVQGAWHQLLELVADAAGAGCWGKFFGAGVSTVTWISAPKLPPVFNCLTSPSAPSMWILLLKPQVSRSRAHAKADVLKQTATLLEAGELQTATRSHGGC